jgi:hypothetical protein
VPKGINTTKAVANGLLKKRKKNPNFYSSCHTEPDEQDRLFSSVE